MTGSIFGRVIVTHYHLGARAVIRNILLHLSTTGARPPSKVNLYVFLIDNINNVLDLLVIKLQVFHCF